MVHSPKVVVKRTVSIDMGRKEDIFFFWVLVTDRTPENNQPRIKGNYFFLHGHLLC